MDHSIEFSFATKKAIPKNAYKSSVKSKNIDRGVDVQEIKNAIAEHYQNLRLDYSKLPAQEELIPLKTFQTVRDSTEMSERFGLSAEIQDRVIEEITYSTTQPALVRVDMFGMNIYWFDSTGELQADWTENSYPSFINGDNVGPTNLRIKDLGSNGTLIWYTNSFYFKSYVIKSTSDQRSYVQSEHMPSISGDGTHIKEIMTVEWDSPSGETIDLYWAQGDRFVGRLFMIDDEGNIQFLTGVDRFRSDQARVISEKIGLSKHASLSDLVRNGSLFTPDLNADYLGHFFENDPQLAPGGRYHYILDSQD